MLTHISPSSSISASAMPGVNHHAGFSPQDEANFAMMETLGEREEEQHRRDEMWEEIQFKWMLESMMERNAWYAAPLYTYGYREEDQFQNTLGHSKNNQEDLAPTNYYSPWNAPEIATPELKMAA